MANKDDDDPDVQAYINQQYGSGENSPPKKPASNSGSGFDMALMSGIVSGFVMAYTRNHYSGAGWILPTGFVYGFSIAGFGPFRFNWLQRIVATGIMFVIGFYGQDILQAFMAPQK